MCETMKWVSLGYNQSKHNLVWFSPTALGQSVARCPGRAELERAELLGARVGTLEQHQSPWSWLVASLFLV